jgi:hypothetical protein
MNSTRSFKNASNTTANNHENVLPDPYLLNVLNFVYNIGYIYVVPSVSVLAFAFNLVSIIVFLHPKLKGKTYKYFVTKTVSELIFAVLGALYPVFFCASCATFGTLGWAILIKYGAGITIQTSYTYSGLCEIAIIYDRLVVLYQIRHFDFDSRVVILSMLVLSFVSFIPGLFASFIVLSAPGQYSIQPTEFGISQGYLWYQALVVVIENIMIIAALVCMNSVLVHKFKTYLARRRMILANTRLALQMLNTSTQNTNNSIEEDLQKRITLMVIIHSSVLIVSRIIVTIDTMFALYYQYSGVSDPGPFYAFDFVNTCLVLVGFIGQFFYLLCVQQKL